MVVADNKFRSMGFAYDANGRQVKATKANVADAWSVYDALGNRVATKVNDVWQFVIYDAFGKLVAEYGNQGEGVGGVSYVLQDWQGSVRASVNNNGFVQARFDFTAFGEEVSLGVGLRSLEQGYTGDATTKQGYGLTEKDSSGQNHTWFRKQEQRAGRWTSPDPYKGSMEVENPQSFNRYSYVESQPTNFVDPMGLFKVGDKCVIRLEDGTEIQGKKDQWGGCNPDIGTFAVTVYISWEPVFTYNNPFTNLIRDRGGEPDPGVQGGSSNFGGLYKQTITPSKVSPKARKCLEAALKKFSDSLSEYKGDPNLARTAGQAGLLSGLAAIATEAARRGRRGKKGKAGLLGAAGGAAIAVAKDELNYLNFRGDLLKQWRQDAKDCGSARPDLLPDNLRAG
jgi:RHS repeat-associated protein